MALFPPSSLRSENFVNFKLKEEGRSAMRKENFMLVSRLTLLYSLLVPCILFSSESQLPSLVASGAKLIKLAGGFSFTEGPTSDKEGNVFFTDQPNNRIMKWTAKGQLITFMQPSGRSNGLYFDPKGNLIACADEKNQLWQISPNKKVKVLVDRYKGKLLNGPNDVWVRSDGTIYFTDPFYRRPYWRRGPMEQECEGVYMLSSDKKLLIRIIDDLVEPNGIVGSADEKLLYVADIKAGKTYVYRIMADGSLKHKRLFCPMGSDGMTVDIHCLLYTSPSPRD